MTRVVNGAPLSEEGALDEAGQSVAEMLTTAQCVPGPVEFGSECGIGVPISGRAKDGRGCLGQPRFTGEEAWQIVGSERVANAIERGHQLSNESTHVVFGHGHAIAPVAAARRQPAWLLAEQTVDHLVGELHHVVAHLAGGESLACLVHTVLTDVGRVGDRGGRFCRQLGIR